MIARLDQHLAGGLPQPYPHHRFAVGAQLPRDGAEVAVAGHKDEGLDLRMGEGGLQRIDHHLDVGGVLAVARTVAKQLRQFDSVFDEVLLVLLEAGPVTVGAANDDASPPFRHGHDQTQITFAVDVFRRDGNVLKIDENRNLRLFHTPYSLLPTICAARRPISTA